MIGLADIPEGQPRHHYNCPGCKTPIPFGTEIKPAPDYCPTCNRRLYIPTIVGPTLRGKGPAEVNPPSVHSRVSAHMDDQRIDQASWPRVMLWPATVLAAIMLVFGVLGAIAALNLNDSPTKHMPVNWPAFIVSAAKALVGLIALFFIDLRMRRKTQPRP